MGALLQGVSRGLFEQVDFDRKRVTSLDWVSYPVLRFVDAPRMHQRAVSRTDVPVDDTARPSQRPDRGRRAAASRASTAVPAAIANALFDATGVRLREMPMTPARVRGALGTATR